MDILDPIHRELRQRKIDYLGDIFSQDLDRSASRFVGEMIWGISLVGSIRLSRIARALEEPIPERATIKRLSRNLGKDGLGAVVGEKVMELGSKRIHQDSLLVVHRYNLLKKHTKSMEYLADIHDRMGRSVGKGYQLCEVIGWDTVAEEMTSLAQTLWSTNAPDYQENNEFHLIKWVRNAMQGRGIIVYPSPIGYREPLIQLTKDPSCRYAFLLPPESRLLYSRRSGTALGLVDLCKTPYGDTVFFDYESRESDLFVHYGFLPVRLPECPDRPLWLVVIRGFDERFAGKDPFMILTTQAMRQNRKVLWQIVETYFAGLWVQSANYLAKQRCGFDDVRVLTYTRLKNMAALVLAASYFSTVFRDFPLTDSPVRFHRRDRRSVSDRIPPASSHP